MATRTAAEIEAAREELTERCPYDNLTQYGEGFADALDWVLGDDFLAVSRLILRATGEEEARQQQEALDSFEEVPNAHP